MEASAEAKATSKRPHRRDKQYIDPIVKLVKIDELPVYQVAEQSGLRANQIYRWIHKQDLEAARQNENSDVALKAELRDVRKENQYLKKQAEFSEAAATYFARQQSRQERKVQIHQIHRQHAGRYGAPRIAKQLKQQGLAVNRKTVARLMQQEQLRAVMCRAFVPQTTDSRHGYAITENLLEQDFSAKEPNTVWVVSSDTQIRALE